MQDFPHYLRDLGRSADPQLGFFGPSSLVWAVSRERVLLLAGMRALLLQVANPKVAQGVADHSDFQRWPVRRMTRTFAAVYAIAFGTREEAIEAALNVHRIHQRVRGTVKDPLPQAVDRRYDANDPELLLWVFATLADSTVSAYGTFFHPLSSQECERYYQDYRMFGRLFGIPDHFFPETWEGLQSWFREELSESRLVITPTARRIFRELLSCTVTARLAAPSTMSSRAGCSRQRCAPLSGFAGAGRSRPHTLPRSQPSARALGSRPISSAWCPQPGARSAEPRCRRSQAGTASRAPYAMRRCESR